MKLKRFAQILLSGLLIAAIAVPLAACGPRGKYKNEEHPFVVAIQELDGVFSPFFSTSAYDGEVAGMTQISMINTDEKGNIDVGEHTPSVVKAYTDVTTDNRTDDEKREELKDVNKYYTTYEFLIKKGIKFSDGVDLTINDVLFNMYTYLDPVYTGSSTMYSTEIKGLAAYRQQDPDAEGGEDTNFEDWFNSEARARRQAVLDYYPKHGGTNPSATIPEATILSDIDEIQKFFRDEITSDYNNFSAQLEDLKDEYKTWDDKDTIFYPWQMFLVMNNMVQIERDEKLEHGTDPEAIIAIDFKAYEPLVQGKSEEEAKNICIQLVFDSYFEDADAMRSGKLAEVVLGWGTSQTYMRYVVADEKTKYFEKVGKQVKTISGITTRKTSTFNGQSLDGDYDVLSVVISGVDPKAIYNFGFTVTPMHYYSNPTSGSGFSEMDGWKGFNADPEVGHFGFKFGDSKYMDRVIRSVNDLPMGAGVYKVANEDLKDVPISQVRPAGTDGFFTSNYVNYVRNTYFHTTGKDSNIHNAKIKKFRYSVQNSSRLYEAVKTNAVYYADPSAKTNVMNDLNNPNGDKTLVYESAKNNGYGYIGINARYVEDQLVRQMIMYAMDTKLVLDYYPSDLANNIYRPMSDQNWAYPEDIVTPKYSSWDADGNFDEEFAKKFIGDTLRDAGYRRNGSNILEKTVNVNGQTRTRTLKFTFTISGADLQDHPTYTTFAKASRILNSVGFETKVSPDARALSKLATGELAVWAAAWSSTIDPDMYQVYHKDSKATSILNWGYPQLLGLNGETGYGTTEELGIINNLSELIDAGRATTDQPTRKGIYRQALEQIMNLAVELPTYQRSNIYVFKNTIIDEKSIYTGTDVTTYRSPLADLWKLSFVGN